MEINISPRRSGKTTRLIDWVKKGEDRVVLFATTEEASYLKKQYPEIADKLYYWIDWREKKDLNKEIGIDNADCVLHKIFGRSIQKLEFNQGLIKKFIYNKEIDQKLMDKLKKKDLEKEMKTREDEQFRVSDIKKPVEFLLENIK